jgi:hypothetical protein
MEMLSCGEGGGSVSSIIHDIRNQLAIAAANVEAFHDGILVPTPERLRAVLDALEAAGATSYRRSERDGTILLL